MLCKSHFHLANLVYGSYTYMIQTDTTNVFVLQSKHTFYVSTCVNIYVCSLYVLLELHPDLNFCTVRIFLSSASSNSIGLTYTHLLTSNLCFKIPPWTVIRDTFSGSRNWAVLQIKKNPVVLSHHCKGLMYSRPKGITLDAAAIRPNSLWNCFTVSDWPSLTLLTVARIDSIRAGRACIVVESHTMPS